MSTKFSELLNSFVNRGYTYGRGRMLVHRWDWRKIKGAKPVCAALAENIVKDNALFKWLTRK